MNRKLERLAICGLLAIALLAAGCGSSDDEPAAPAATAADESGPANAAGDDDEKAGADAGAKLPKPLAENRAQANEILEEGSLDAKLADLEGYPVVVNQWASWCDPCREEFPYFQAAAEKYADEVAFLGIDMEDARDSAEAFLEEFPVPYPSVYDPTAEAIGSLGGGVVSPTTVFIGADGETVEIFQGVYVDQAQLDADIENLLAKG